MQTFLPYPNFAQSVACLDYRRLGKQRVECLQLLKALGDRERVDLSDVPEDFKPKGWVNHPATQMWRGYEPALALYHDACIAEWVKRGYNNTMRFRSMDLLPVLPPWLGDPFVHASHRSNLLRKDPAHYGQFGWVEGPDLPYVWPTV